MSGRAPGKTIAFFPWLDLPSETTIGDVRFLPFRVGVRSTELRPIRRALQTLLPAYKEVDGAPVSGVTVAVPIGRTPGDYLRPVDQRLIQTAALLLCLSTLARSDYCPRATYANSLPFRPLFHTYAGRPERIVLSARKRLGGVGGRWVSSGRSELGATA